MIIPSLRCAHLVNRGMQLTLSHPNPQVTVLLNLSAVLLALEECGEAASRCSEVLKMDPGNTTALLRRAKARVIRREFEVGWTAKARAIRQKLEEDQGWCGNERSKYEEQI